MTRFVVCPLLLMSFLSVPPVGADDRLRDERWSEPGYGLSLRPPAHTQTLEHASDGALAKFIAGDEYDISVFIQETPVHGDVMAIARRALDKFSFAYPSRAVIHDESFRPADRPGWKLYLSIPDEENPDWVLGQAFMQIDPRIYAVMQFQCDQIDYEQVKGIFEAMLDSIELTDVKQIEARRAALIQTGQGWAETLDADRLRSVLVPEQWFRVVRGESDVGWMRVSQSETVKLDLPGIYVQVWAHIEDGPEVVDTDSDFFESHDGTTEVWSVRSTRRDAGPGPVLPQVGDPSPGQSWAETGLRSDHELTVTQQSPSGVHEMKWRVPEPGYMSQVKLHLLPGLLPRDKPVALAFYSFHSNSANLALRTIDVTLLDGGAFLVKEKPATNAGTRQSIYDARGGLQRREMADGTVMIPVTRRQIKSIYGIR